MLSILIPTYNYDCSPLVRQLLSLYDTIDEEMEIIVGDDCSPDTEIAKSLERLNETDGVRTVRPDKNMGRSGIRNLLAQQAKGEWVLYIDSDSSICDRDFLKRYWDARSKAEVIEGAILHPEKCPDPDKSLRYYYEKSAEPMFTAEKRNAVPHSCFRTFTFMARRDVMLRVPFNENFWRYGYEDTLFGQELQRSGISVFHIDNPLMHLGLEPNRIFLEKMEEANATLMEFYEELRPNSRIIHCYERLRSLHAIPAVRLAFRLTKPLICRNLLSPRPSVFLLNCYKIGNFCDLMHKKQD